MIEQGTNGLSCGSTDEGVMVGGNMLLHVPLNLTATECHPPLQNWIMEWAPQETEFLLPSNWFEKGHDIVGGYKGELDLWYPTLLPGTYVWELPPPAAAAVATEELQHARHKQQLSTYI
eukprot:8151807-Ditylum_brightwellii.AAC.2